MRLYNSTFYEAGASFAVVETWNNSAATVTTKNNVFYESSGTTLFACGGSTINSDHDSFFGGGAATGGTGTIRMTHDITTDPLFADRDNDDFTLQSNSECNNNGTSDASSLVTMDLVGRTYSDQTYDIGAYSAP